MTGTGQRINELENGPSSYRLKMEYFGSNRVGFDVVSDFAYKNLDQKNLAADWLIILVQVHIDFFSIQNNCGDGGDRESTEFSHS